MDNKQLIENVQDLFGKRASLMMLWQEQAENFYPERADFTYIRNLGTDFAANTMTSFPILCRRDLADQCGSMLRPTAKEWFHMVPSDPGRENNESKRWLDWATKCQRRAMYDIKSRFSRATKEADNDFSCFGQAVMSVRLNKMRDRLLYRTWHLRDCTWQENESGGMALVARKWKPRAIDLVQEFGKDKVHRDVITALDTGKPFQEFECIHVVCESTLVEDKIATKGKPYYSLYWDVAHAHAMEELPTWNREYIVPRWLTVSGSQYAFSPATVAALPEARLLQAMTYTLLEAGEKVTNPPMVATDGVVRSDMAIYAGGVIWVDRDYDERLGQALRPMTIDAKGMPIGMEMQQQSRGILTDCFYLNRLRPFNPSTDPEMTAYQAGQIVQDYIRHALPLFEPMEQDYNGAVCEVTFDLMLRANAFGSPYDMPKVLQNADIDFRFESPLHDAIEQLQGQKFLEAKSLIAQAIDLDPSAKAVLDANQALRDALDGIQTPARWIRSETTVQQIADAQRAAEESQQVLTAMQQGSEVAANLGAAARDQAQAMPA